MKAKNAVREKDGRRAGLRAGPPNWRVRDAGKLKIVEAAALAEQAWLVHGFSTRVGGTSQLESRCDGQATRENVLNLGFTEWDTRERVASNRRLFADALCARRMQLVSLRQIHSDLIRLVGEEAHANNGANRTKILASETYRGDALITRSPGLLLAVQTADCIPILLADPVGRAVAAIHAGWRGTLRRIAGKTAGRMQMEFGTRPPDLIAALGPGIGRCCYEVGPEVTKELKSQFHRAHEWLEGPVEALESGEDPTPLPWLTMMPPGHQPPPPRVKLDLLAANRAILIAAGLRPENILVTELCTSCRPDLLFSYRRERPTGRMMAVIGRR
jgi:polyphenol oxidase